MSRRHLALAATIASLAASTALLPVAAAAAEEGESVEMQFTYGVDHSAWYWVHQRDEEIDLAPLPLNTRQSLPSGQDENTLPVAAEAGEPSKLSAMRFDLAERGVPEGSTVTRFVLRIAEGTDGGEFPAFNPAGNDLRACRATDAWSPVEADLWDAQPATIDDCVTGTREEIDLESGEFEDESLAATWTFDLTPLAAEWGEDPFANHGVVLDSVIADDAGVADTWQVNLKLPRRNDPTTPIDEYEETAHRVFVEMSHVPGEPDPDPGDEANGPDPSEPATGSDPSEDSSAGDIDGDTAGSGSIGDIGGGSAGGTGGVSSGGLPADDDVQADDFVEGDAEPDAKADEHAVPVASEPFIPSMPWYAWLLIPAALVVTTLIRGALVEPTSSARPNSVIEKIRERNASRRGAALPAPTSRLSRLITSLSLGRGAQSI